jgi:Holliday junction resolvase RusA-like endonuclease
VPLRAATTLPTKATRMTYSEDITGWKRVKSIKVPGQPVAKGRPRLARRGRFTRAYTPEKTVKFEHRVAVFSRGAILPPGVPILVQMRFIFKRPKRLMRRKDPDGLIPHLSKPDGDNVEKAVLDGLSGVVYHDDSQVFGSGWRKYYAEKATPKNARIEITVYTPQQSTEDEMK